MPETASTAAIHATELSKDFGRVIALRQIDLVVNPGEFVTLFGRNGAGKTTLLNLVSGVTQPSSGSVSIFGDDPRKLDIRRRLAVISHDIFLYDNLTAIENLEFVADMFGLSDSEERIKEVLQEVGLYHRRFDLIQTFSRGMLQRLTIARALLHKPDLLLLDEPFTGLDQHAIALLLEILRKQKEAGRTIMLTTHDLYTGVDLADRFLIIERHRIRDSGSLEGMTAEELRSRYFALIDSMEAGR